MNLVDARSEQKVLGTDISLGLKLAGLPWPGQTISQQQSEELIFGIHRRISARK